MIDDLFVFGASIRLDSKFQMRSKHEFALPAPLPQSYQEGLNVLKYGNVYLAPFNMLHALLAITKEFSFLCQNIAVCL